MKAPPIISPAQGVPLAALVAEIVDATQHMATRDKSRLRQLQTALVALRPLLNQLTDKAMDGLDIDEETAAIIVQVPCDMP